MIHIISVENNTYNMLEYLHDESFDYSYFNEGISLKGVKCNLVYQAKSKSAFNKLKHLHLISSTGPDLVSREFRCFLEKNVPDEVEFFDAAIVFGEQKLDGFSAINPVVKINCCDMVKSEFQLMNFDPNNPVYMFLYTVLLDEIPYGLNIVRCAENPNLIVVSDKIKNLFVECGLKGMKFCKSIDITPKGRSDCDIIV